MNKNQFIEAYKDSPLFAVLRARAFRISDHVINDWELAARVVAARVIH